ncbi:MAG TPA: HNH endonuclease signature motif containing protein [Pyrinomonadaceae bacterium]|jgi:5-methylcytosine-specific restriction endonuclease McrA
MESSARPEVTPELLAELSKVGWIKDQLLLLVLARADFRCEYCGQDLVASFNDCFNAQKDHLVPKVKGGAENDENLAACCITCNALKWDYVPQGDCREG